MSFARYPAYVASAEEWIGEIPAHWPAPPLYSRYEVLLGKMLDEKRQTGTVALPYVRNVNVQWDHVDVTDLPQMDVALHERERFTLRRGDLLVCEGGDIGRTATWNDEVEVCAFQKALHRLRPLTDEENPRFLYYTMRAASDAGVFLARGNPNTIPHLTGEALRVYRFPKPARGEQDAVVSFLDRETAKIDGLVEEQHRLIALLDEKRQAVISHAVTKGLNPDSPTKVSAFEGISVSPAHWALVPLRRVVRRIEQGWSPECLGWPAESGEWGVLKTGCANGGVFDEQQNKALPPSLDPLPELEVKPGDVLMSRASGSREFVGATAFVESVRARLMLSDKIFRLLLEDGVDPRFFAIVCGSRLIRSQIERAISGAGGLANNLPQSSLVEFLFPLPPVFEQQSIVGFVGTVVRQYKGLSGEAERAIALLLERRSALITAAVTGQIDVRALASTEAP